MDSGLQNGFVSAFEMYLEIEESPTKLRRMFKKRFASFAVGEWKLPGEEKSLDLLQGNIP